MWRIDQGKSKWADNARFNLKVLFGRGNCLANMSAISLCYCFISVSDPKNPYRLNPNRNAKGQLVGL